MSSRLRLRDTAMLRPAVKAEQTKFGCNLHGDPLLVGLGT